MDECSVLNINSDFIVKLDIFKKLMEDYERELYEIIINDDKVENYLKLKEDKIKNGGNRN